ncbi:MAG: hypothetical protein VKQ33_16455, partial [Candidatus Sericytochromatia bacterium]|nr:hypothetical protein [Candidatus Sericytochromatia bacterium]
MRKSRLLLVFLLLTSFGCDHLPKKAGGTAGDIREIGKSLGVIAENIEKKAKDSQDQTKAVRKKTSSELLAEVDEYLNKIDQNQTEIIRDSGDIKKLEPEIEQAAQVVHADIVELEKLKEENKKLKEADHQKGQSIWYIVMGFCGILICGGVAIAFWVN